MAGVDFPKGSREWVMIAEFWLLCKRYWIVEDNDEWWNEVTDAANIFCKKYEDIILPRMLADALIRFLECKRNRELEHGEEAHGKH